MTDLTMASLNWTGCKKLISGAERIWILFGPNIEGDALTSALALKFALEQIKKQAEVISPFSLPDHLSFLPGFESISRNFSPSGGTLVLSLRGVKNKLEEFWYEEEGQNVKFLIAPKPGQVLYADEAEVTVVSRLAGLVICIGLSSPEALADHYPKFASLFFNNPVLNIDNRVENINYGQVNVIDLTLTSLSEVTFELLLQAGLPLNADLATLLFAGLTLRTSNFQSIRTNPGSLAAAARLMDLGADQQKIVRHLYKTRSLAHLKLWGRALAGLTIYPTERLVVSVIRGADIKNFQVTETDVSLVWKDLLSTLADVRFLAFLVELAPGYVQVFTFAKSPADIRDVLVDWKGGNFTANTLKHTFSNTDLKKIKADLVLRVKSWLKTLQ